MNQAINGMFMLWLIIRSNQSTGNATQEEEVEFFDCQPSDSTECDELPVRLVWNSADILSCIQSFVPQNEAFAQISGAVEVTDWFQRLKVLEHEANRWGWNCGQSWMLWLSATWDAFDEAKKDSVIKMISNQTSFYLSAVTNCFIARYRLQKIESFKPLQFIIDIGLIFSVVGGFDGT